MSNNIVLAWPNIVYKATLTSPETWSTTMPLSELQNPINSDQARVSATSTTINAEFSEFQAMGVVSLVAHNLTVTATVNVKFYYDTAQTELLYDSGTVDAWPSVFDSVDLNWEDDNFWDGKPNNEQRQQFTALTNIFADNVYTGKSVKITITDTDNTDGYIQMGLLMIAPYFIPEINPAYEGFERSLITKTTVVECNGTKYFRRQQTIRMQTINLAYLNQSEALQKIHNMQYVQGIDKEILYADSIVPDQYSIATTLIGTLEQLSPIAQPNFAQYGAKINIIEKI